MADPTPQPAVPQPALGGSYTRDPVTGELHRTQHTAAPAPEAQPDTPEA